MFFFFFQAEDGIRDLTVTGVQTCALPICGQDTNLVDYVRITYAHTYTADNDALSISVNDGATARVAGFSNGDVRVIDVTDQNAIQELSPVVTQQSDGSFTADLQVANASSQQPHVLYVFASAQA